ncbi:MAG: hypothetical protein WCW14_00635 [Candidatus Paceibacterota bacterium]
MATISTYRTMVQNEVGDAAARAQNVIDRALSDTYQEILLHTAKNLIGLTEEDVTASISNRYVTPVNTYSNFEKVLWHSATDTNFKELTLISEDEYYDRYVNSSTSEPSQYYLKGNLVYFDVIPSSAGTVKVVGTEVQDELTGANVSVIPDRFTRVLILGAIGRFKSYEGTPDADEYLKQFKGSFWGQGRIEGALGDMIRELSVKKRVIRPRLFGR